MKKTESTHTSQEKHDDEARDWFNKTDFGKSSDTQGVLWTRESGVIKRGRKPIGKRLNIVLSEETIEELKLLSKKKGLGYQTLIRTFVLEKIEEQKKKDAG